LQFYRKRGIIQFNTHYPKKNIKKNIGNTMGRELEIKRRQLSTHPQHSIRSRQCSAMEGSTEQSSQKEGVRRLVPSVPNEQVEMLKTNVGRLKICKRHIVPTTVLSSGLSSSGSKGVASRLKLVRPNRVLGG